MTVAFVALALMAGSCSSDGDSVTGTSGDLGLDTNTPSDEVAVVDELFVLADGDRTTPAAALLMAIDRGYEINTVSAAILGHQFNLDGIVLDSSGNHFRPSGSDTGFISDKAPLNLSEETGGGVFEATPVKLAFQRNTVTRSELLSSLLTDMGTADLGFGAGAAPPPENRAQPWESLDDQDAFNRAHTLRLISMIAAGNSAERIIQAIVFGEAVVCNVDDGEYGDCTLSGLGTGGVPLEPATSTTTSEPAGTGDSSVPEETVEPESDPADLALPWVFEGVGRSFGAISMGFGAGQRTSWDYPTDLTIIFNADGTIEYYSSLVEQPATSPSPNCGTGEIAMLPPRSVLSDEEYSGTHADGIVVVTTPGTLTFEGTYTAEELTVSYDFANTSSCDGAGSVTYTGGATFIIPRVDP